MTFIVIFKVVYCSTYYEPKRPGITE